MQVPWPPVLSWNKARHWQVGPLYIQQQSRTDIHKDAHGDVLRGLQVVETAIGITSTLLGEKIEGDTGLCSASTNLFSTVSKDMDTEVRKVPLGVCARSVLELPIVTSIHSYHVLQYRSI